jgi:peptide/nickel transport system substrate-binding protein
MSPSERARGLSRRQLFANTGKAGLLVASLGGIGELLEACSSGTTAGAQGVAAAAGAPTRGGTLNAAVTGNPSGLDPTVDDIYTGTEVYDNIFSKLVEMQPNGSIGPSLATKWTQKTPTTWVFDLVDNATFHNGEKFTAADVKYTFDRILDKATGSPYLSDYNVIDGVEVISPTQVMFTLTRPFGPFLTNLSLNAQIVNQKAIEAGNSKLKPIGTGPFQFVSWQQNQGIVVKRFPGYFVSGQPYLDGINFQFLENNQTRVQALESGQLDWADSVPLSQLPSLKSNSAVQVVSSSAAGLPDFLALNTSRPPFNNKALRQALAYAIGTAEIVKLAYFGVGAEPGGEEVGTASPWYGGKNPYGTTSNITMAKQKLAEAGYSRGFSFDYLGLSQYPNLLTTGEVIQSQLAKIGVTMNIDQMEVTAWLDKYAASDYQATSGYWAGTVDPDNFFSNIILTGGPDNFTKYSNPTVDKLITQANTATTMAERKPLYEQIRGLVWDDSPLIFTAYETTNYVMTTNVHGSTINPPLDLRLGQAWKTA